ncbi:MAG TPA: PD-(D/E)XK nuclease family protein, partial [Polyangiaceae bacterium]
SSRASLLAKTMAGVEALLAEAKLVDRRAIARDLARSIERADPDVVASAVGARQVTAALVVDWSPADLAWWRALDGSLARLGGGARVELPLFAKGIDAARDRDPLETLVDDVASKLDAPPLTQTIAPRFGDLLFLEDATVTNVELRRSADVLAQARAVASAVLSALADGVLPDDVAIAVCGSDQNVTSAIDRIFRQIGIPVVATSRRRPLDVPIVRDAMALFACVLGEPLVAEIRALQGSPFVEGEVAPAIEAARLRLSKGSTWRHRIEAARGILADFGLSPRPSSWVKSTLADDRARETLATLELEAHADNARGWAALLAALDALEAAASRLGLLRSTVDPAEVIRALERSLEAPLPPSANARAGAVTIGRAADFAGEANALCIVVDANEGALPGRPRVSPVVADALAQKLRDVDATKAPLANAVANASEYAALAAAVANAARVVVTYRTQGGEGDAVGPSPLVAWLVRSNVPETIWHSGPLAGAPLSPREAALRTLAFDPAARAIVAPGEAHRAELELARETFHSRRVPSPQTADLSAAPQTVAFLDRVVATDPHPLSVTTLEDFARCAFRGAAKGVLKARDAEPDAEVPDARERGQLVHEALRAAFAATAPLFVERPRNAEKIRAGAIDAALGTLRTHEASLSATRAALQDVVRRQVLEEVSRILDFAIAEDAFDPLLVEQPFGPSREDGAWPALTVEHEGQRAVLQGKIDRVDVAHGERARVRAVDYKSNLGAAKDAHKKLGDTTLQVPLYARAAMTSLDADRAEGLYIPARDIPSAMTSRGKFDAKWDEIGAREKTRPDLARRVLEILGDVRQGKLMPIPNDPKDCDYCNFDGVCRRPRFVVTEENESGDDD